MGGQRDTETFTVCNICNVHGSYNTRSSAFTGMLEHLSETGHRDQRYSTPTSNGWRPYSGPEA